ncbi:flagellar basal body-associated FliL family protein [uncultured Agrobacterium sp.]|uniref:flagellar basal body-associated FliL family protein n=1 Tax=uncultured Agrobacterium sp. TaxID=157277 RepID=UPI0025F0B316|nr:flagellar basal body-associated FliL family protein [uncultured Agrobacterium sp.]
MTDQLALEGPAPKKSSPIPVIGAVAVLSLLGLGGGWFVGKMLFVPAPPASTAATVPAPAPEAPAETAAAGGHEAPKAEAHGEAPKGEGHGAAAGPSLVNLDPIITNLGYPAENWVRLELALQFNGPSDPALVQELHQELMAYVRTVPLQQIQGPRGFQYLRDDLTEIVDLRSKGRVSKVLFKTFVIE